MVNFNNETTIATSPALIVKISFLERRKYVIDAIEYYEKTKFRNSQSGEELSILRARLISLFYEVRESLNRHLKEKDMANLEKEVKSKEYDNLIKAFDEINNWFDTKRLTMIDNIKPYDSTDVETENLARGL